MNNQKDISFTVTATSLFALLLNYIGIGLVFPLFPQLCYDTQFHLLTETATLTERSIILGLLLSIMPLTQFFFAPLLGTLSDEQGRRPLLIKSLSMGIIGYGLGAYAVFSSSLLLLLLSRVIVGISTSNSSVIAASLADSSSKEERASHFSLYGTCTGAGMALGPFIGALLSNHELFSLASYALPFIAAGFMTICNLLAVLKFFPKKTGQQIQERPPSERIQSHKLLWDSFFEKKFRLLFLVAFLFYYGWTFFWEFMPVTVMHTIDYPSRNIGYIYMTGAIAYVILSLILSRKLVSKIDISLLLPISTGVLAFFIGLTGMVQNTFQLFELVIVQQFFLSCIYPLFSTYVSKASSESHQGRALGMLNAVKALACSLGPLCSGMFFSLSALGPVIIGVLSLALSGLLGWKFFSLLQREKMVLEQKDVS